MSRSDQRHLSQRQLAEIDGIDGIVRDLARMLEGARFQSGKKEGEEYCVAPDLPQAALPLFRALGLKEVKSF
jgi:hypothetical protein